MGERREIYTIFCWKNLRESDHLEDKGVDGIVIFRSIFRDLNVRVRNGSSCVRIRTVGGYL